ncbi:glycosyl hydrolase family 92-domain-containing protein [Mycena maculata]|uniref:Glycosyl hydrolase family 92-domain-containing protein n=1 Tax=Mycena maculata TaxID=230809 RepID=A0AAD7ITZ7_9AGAR|nr:glycosyl hydrolase family 92-domain-containing protein [Mycena maculata]
MASSLSRVLWCCAALTASADAVELTSLVNLFIGTGSSGNAFPGSYLVCSVSFSLTCDAGAAIPHAMAKVGIDVSTAPRQAGYLHDNSSITGISLMHNEGTGGNSDGGYGIFPLFPLIDCSFASCPVDINVRAALRANNTDAATPGYFTSTFVNNIKLETTSTRRAGLIRFTYPTTGPNFVVIDLTNDLGRSFSGGTLSIAPAGRVQLSGTFLQSYGLSNYTAFACYDFTPPQGSQPISQFGTYQSTTLTSPNNITITPETTNLNFPFTATVSPEQAGALISFTNTKTVVARFGVSMISSEQACSNAEEEVPDWDFDAVQSASASAWEDVLERVTIDTTTEDPTVVELLYSSLYRASLVPANFSGENPYWDSPYAFWDEFFCSWDTFRTVHPLLSILDPVEWAQIINAYVDGWRHTGYIPECRAETQPGYVQGGDDGMVPVGDFAVKYGSRASELGVPIDDLYQALVDTAENTPPDWYTIGRQNTAWKTFNYIPTNWVDPSGSVGLPTREGSRALEYAVGDFAVRQAAIALNQSPDDIAKYSNRSMNFVNMWDPNVTSDGYSGFIQRRYTNGTFAFSDPTACSPVNDDFSCARGTDNDIGFYESSSWEYSFFAPQSMSTVIKLMGGPDTFVPRVDHYFAAGYYYAGNEPGFAMPFAYNYANRPDLTSLRVRNVVYTQFSAGIDGIPGNDDSGAMASLLVFDILGLYPVPASKQLLVGSPLLSAFTLRNDFLGTSTSFTVTGFDKTGLSATPPAGAAVYVKSIKINGAAAASLCWINWDDVVGGGTVEIEVYGDATAAAAAGCGDGPNALPDSLETGGFSPTGGFD